jgi:hypothetical protein
MRWSVLAASTLVALASPAWAGSKTSTYSTLNFETDCKTVLEAEEGGGVWLLCDGFKDIPVHVAEGDLRMSVKFGGTAGNAQGTWQSFGAFNSIGETVEWRLDDGHPFATILRWTLDFSAMRAVTPGPEHRGQVLVISTIDDDAGNPSCMAGLVDARANENANELARQIADTIARSFKCGTDTPQFHGKQGSLVSLPN